MCFFSFFFIVSRFFVVPRYDAIFYVFLYFLDFVLVAVVSSTRFNGGVLLGPLSLVTSVPIASNPNPHLCASSLVLVVSLASRSRFVF